MNKIIPWVVTGVAVVALVVFALGRVSTNKQNSAQALQISNTTSSFKQNANTASTTVITDVTVMKYEIVGKPATTTPLQFQGVALVVPWSDVVRQRGEGSWSFKNGKYIFISASTSTTKSIWQNTNGIQKIIPIESLSDYDLEKLVWESNAQDAVNLESGKSKNTADVKKGMLGGLKLVKYSWCGQLLEFQNSHNIKGIVCKWLSNGKPTVNVNFYPYDGTEYSLMFSADNQSEIDSIISTIRTNESR